MKVEPPFCFFTYDFAVVLFFSAGEGMFFEMNTKQKKADYNAKNPPPHIT